MPDTPNSDLLERATALLSVNSTEAAGVLCLLDIAHSLRELRGGLETWDMTRRES